ncbi:MAG: low affinity iron permease family protein [Candidatus Limnocylindria bacterium]
MQHSQNRDSRALHAKLDERIAAIPDARDELERLEERTEEEIGLIPRGKKGLTVRRDRGYRTADGDDLLRRSAARRAET